MHQHRPESVIFFFFGILQWLFSTKELFKFINDRAISTPNPIIASQRRKPQFIAKVGYKLQFHGVFRTHWRWTIWEDRDALIRNHSELQKNKNKNQRIADELNYYDLAWLAKCKKMLWRVEDAWKSNNHQLHNIKHWDLNGNEFQFLSLNFQHERRKKMSSKFHSCKFIELRNRNDYYARNSSISSREWE